MRVGESRKHNMEKKLILPAEVKVCATCSYWDGERRVDDELSLVVVAEDCRGECLVQEQHFDGLVDVRQMPHCQWEPLEGDEDPDDAAVSVVRASAAG